VRYEFSKTTDKGISANFKQNPRTTFNKNDVASFNKLMDEKSKTVSDKKSVSEPKESNKSGEETEDSVRLADQGLSSLFVRDASMALNINTLNDLQGSLLVGQSSGSASSGASLVAGGGIRFDAAAIMATIAGQYLFKKHASSDKQWKLSFTVLDGNEVTLHLAKTESGVWTLEFENKGTLDQQSVEELAELCEQLNTESRQIHIGIV